MKEKFKFVTYTGNERKNGTGLLNLMTNEVLYFNKTKNQMYSCVKYYTKKYNRTYQFMKIKNGILIKRIN